eukprot:15437_1
MRVTTKYIEILYTVYKKVPNPICDDYDDETYGRNAFRSVRSNIDTVSAEVPAQVYLGLMTCRGVSGCVRIIEEIFNQKLPKAVRRFLSILYSKFKPSNPEYRMSRK